MNLARRLDPHDDPTAVLWQRYRGASDSRARTQLLDGYLGLVHHAAREVARRGARTVELDELISAGTVGLVQALEGFDPNRGQAFSSYAMPRIRGAILDELRSLDWRSRGGRSRVRTLERAQAQLEQQLGRRAEAHEIAAALNVDLETYWKWNAERDSSPPVTLSLVESNDDTGVAGIAERIADTSAELPEDAMVRSQSLATLREVFLSLPEKDRLVLAFSFEEELSLREIAQMLHVTESRVSQIRTRALKRLRENFVLKEERS